MGLTAEYTTPLVGRPYYESIGIIKAVDARGSCFPVGEIAYQRFDDQNYQYVITPYWDEISYLTTEIFDGIPGIDLEAHRERYFRVNMTPAFVEMRSPSPSREDLWELLESVGLDYYDRFEWMLRTRKRCGDDNLIVVRKRPGRVYENGIEGIDLNDLQTDDEIHMRSLTDVPVKNKELSYTLYRILASGAALIIKEDPRVIMTKERDGMIYLLKSLLSFAETYPSRRQQEGIRNAKAEKKYRGRKSSRLIRSCWRMWLRSITKRRSMRQRRCKDLALDPGRRFLEDFVN